jgi:NAD(P)-dependent dehydrogenase (short-subunit alcohol dehydrogenase family)
MQFSGKTAVVTGAGSGIGRALALGFARDGARVVAVGRTQRDLEATAAQAEPGGILWIAADVGRSADVERIFAEANARCGRVDILVNNAALYPKQAFLDAPFADWEEAMRVNVIGLAQCCRLALPGMLERGFGRILNVGSFAWRGPIPASSAYSASKAAVHVLTQAIAREIDPQRYPDVLVNEFLPGVYRTRMSEFGEDPSAAYPHARAVASLPAGSPSGATYVRSELWVEERGLRARLRRLLSRR